MVRIRQCQCQWKIKQKLLAFPLAGVIIATLTFFNYSVVDDEKKPVDKVSISEKETASLRLCYQPRKETNNTDVGLELRDAEPYRDILDQPLNSTITPTIEIMAKFVIVTATDNSFFHVNMDAIGNMQRLLPDRTIIFYDLDTTPSPVTREKLKTICGVIYRQFNYSKYPSHVRYLHNYAFKSVIILEVLTEYPVIFWVDSSIRFLSSNLSLAYDKAVRNGGILTFGYSSHPIFPATHSGMYRYLPISKEWAVKSPMYEAGCTLVARTEQVYANIIRWWVACALVEPCIAPTKDLECRFRGSDVYANCHRFDQSAINILMANHYLYDNDVYFYDKHKKLTEVVRDSKDKEHLVLCLPGGNILLRKSKDYFR